MANLLIQLLLSSMDKQSFPNRLLQEWVAIHGLPQGLSLYFYTEKIAKSFTGTHMYL